MNRGDQRRLRWLQEAERELQPFHSRSWFPAHPDVSFTAMNGDVPLQTSPYHEDGHLERLELVKRHLPGVDDVITRTSPERGRCGPRDARRRPSLWTARGADRVGRSRACRSIPSWDGEGMRMEIVR